MTTRKKLRMHCIVRKYAGTSVIVTVDHLGRTADRDMQYIGA